MGKYPQVQQRVLDLRPSVFAVLAEKIAKKPDKVYPLHIGDTYRQAPTAARQLRNEKAVLSTYGHPAGLPALRVALADKLQNKNGMGWITSNEVLPTCGGTHGLFCAAQALFGPGDEVLVLAPFWPLIPGIIQSTGATPVQVPFYQELLQNPDLDIAAIVEQYRTSRTAGIYVTTPNNPDGCVLGLPQMQALADWVWHHQLWVLSDEAYENTLYESRKHHSFATMPHMQDRTVSVFTFSKSHALSGLRIGYVAASAPTMELLRKIFSHSVYNIPALAQHAALAALEEGEAWQDETHNLYQQAANLVHSTLKGRFHQAQGGVYVFYDTTSVADNAWEFIDCALDVGVSVAPGEAFGKDFTQFVRICFTAVDLQDLPDVIRRLNSIL